MNHTSLAYLILAGVAGLTAIGMGFIAPRGFAPLAVCAMLGRRNDLSR